MGRLDVRAFAASLLDFGSAPFARPDFYNPVFDISKLAGLCLLSWIFTISIGRCRLRSTVGRLFLYS